MSKCPLCKNMYPNEFYSITLGSISNLTKCCNSCVKKIESDGEYKEYAENILRIKCRKNLSNIFDEIDPLKKTEETEEEKERQIAKSKLKGSIMNINDRIESLIEKRTEYEFELMKLKCKKIAIDNKIKK